MDQIAIVVSPLMSLMEDQVMALQRKGIKACLLGSMNPNDLKNLKNFQVIYLTPKYFYETGKAKLKTIKNKVCLVAIDECHCITQFGSDFRPKFRKLSQFKSFLPDVPIVCLTATATRVSQEDICAWMSLKNPLIIKADLDRPNLEFTVIKRSSRFINEVKKYLTKVTSGAVIIYVLKRHETVQYSEALNREGFISRPYHAGMNDKDRHQVADDFSTGKLRFVVATIAFGMGIDRADVRLVIHYGCPKNIESYYQESGRAGRDGEPAKCIIIWDERDLQFHRHWLTLSKIEDYKVHCQNLLLELKTFLESLTCRRMSILRCFDSNHPQLPIHESCCDNCLTAIRAKIPLRMMYKGINKKGLLDLSNDARDLLSLCESYDGKCEERNFLNFFMGQMPIRSDKNHPLKLFAKGKSKQEAWWTEVFTILLKRKMMKKFIEVQHIPVPAVENANDDIDYEVEVIVRRDDYLKLTGKGRKFLRYKTKVLEVFPRQEILQLIPKTNREYFIENGEVKYKPRKLRVLNKTKVFEVKSEVAQALFKFEFIGSRLMKSPEKQEPQVSLLIQELQPSLKQVPQVLLKQEPQVNDGAGCSHWSKQAIKVEPKAIAALDDVIEISDDETDDDEHLENFMEVHNRTRHPLNVELDDFLSFLETHEVKQKSHKEDLSSQAVVMRESQELEPPQEPENTSNRYDLIEGCSLHFALKRLGSNLMEEDAEPPSKITRLSEEIAT